MYKIVSAFLLVGALVSPVPAQEDRQEIPQEQFQPQIQQLQFEKPTRIVGKLRALDGYEDAIWIEWTHRHDGRRWVGVPNEMMFKVVPRDAGMMDFFRAMKIGTSFHMTVQMDQEGNRRILELEGT